jgi:hypothetical protein
MTLIDQANKIIEQPAHTDEDITQLQRIKRKMAKLYDEYSSSSWLQEQLYNSVRADVYIKTKKKMKENGKKYTENECDFIAKQQAEKQYWEYRTNKARSQSFKAIIEAIKDFCVDYYTRQKNQNDASR